MKVLYVATSDIHINTFHIPYLRWLQMNGCEIHLVVENRGDLKIPYVERVFDVPFPRKPISHRNIVTYRHLKKIIDEADYNIVHCHTPIPGALIRLAARKARKKSTKVIYTVHGFHFYKGAGLLKWISYYPIEYVLSAYTDAIVTMNKEDFGYVQNKMLHSDSFYIPGVGVNDEIFYSYDSNRRYLERKRLGLKTNEFVLLYVAEFISRKNHRMIIDAIQILKSRVENLKVLFAGKGVLLEDMKKYALDRDVLDYIVFMGFRNDIPVLSAISDVGISASRQEGLPIGILQEMFCSIPIVASSERGHKELITHGENGFLFEHEDVNGFADYINTLYIDKRLRMRMGSESYKTARKFSIQESLAAMSAIYQNYL